MPIRIPLMQRRGLSGSPTMVEGRRVGFVPPHLIDSGAIGTESLKGGVASSLGLSPTAAVKREKLIARNNILRSTGFIEVQQFAAPMGEVIDSVKESMMPGTRPPIGTQRRPTGASSLTALLGTSSG